MVRPPPGAGDRDLPGPDSEAGPEIPILYGPTASGKSALALALAERLDGVIINADSMQLYAELEILTARPGADELGRAPHRLYGTLSAATAGSVETWRLRALAEIDAALAAGRLPIVAGGTGLYLKALTEGLSPLPGSDPEARAAATRLFRELGGDKFRAELAKRDPQTAARLEPGDRQRLVRAWEVVEATGVPLSVWQARPRDKGHGHRFSFLELRPRRAGLNARIDARFVSMVERGALDEAARFRALGLDPALPAHKALGLPELGLHLDGVMDLDQAVRAAQQATRHYAKRQSTWFRHQLAPERHLHARHAVLEQFSESELAKIISFVLPAG